jgi:hypothetical protein
MNNSFLEIKSKNYKITELEPNEVLTSPVEEYSLNYYLPFEETYLKNFLYYDSYIGSWRERTKGNTEFDRTIEENKKLHPNGIGGGFIGFGGYKINKLPELGQQWNNSNGFEMEQRVYVAATQEGTGYKSWLEVDFEDNSLYDLVYGDTYENAFALGVDGNDEETIEFDSEISTKFGSTLFSTSAVELSTWLAKEEVKTTNIIANLSTISGNILEVPTKINGSVVNGLDNATPLSISQMVVPTKDLFVLYDNQFLEERNKMNF